MAFSIIINYVLFQKILVTEGPVNTDGDFNVQVDCIALNCVVNNLSSIFYKWSAVEDLFMGIVFWRCAF